MTQLMSSLETQSADLAEGTAAIVRRADSTGSSPISSAETSLSCTGLAVDLGGDEAREKSRALAVADQHDAAPIIVVGEIALPRRLHVGIGHLAIGGGLSRRAALRARARSPAGTSARRVGRRRRSARAAGARSSVSSGPGVPDRSSASCRARRWDRHRSSRSAASASGTKRSFEQLAVGGNGRGRCGLFAGVVCVGTAEPCCGRRIVERRHRIDSAAPRRRLELQAPAGRRRSSAACSPPQAASSKAAASASVHLIGVTP